MAPVTAELTVPRIRSVAGTSRNIKETRMPTNAHAALHGGQRKRRERATVNVVGKSACRFHEALLYRIDPAFEIGGQQLADGGIWLVKLERDAPDRTAVGALGPHEVVAIPIEQRE